MKLNQWNVRSGVGLFAAGGTCQCAVSSGPSGETRLIANPAGATADLDAGRLLAQLKPELGKGRFRIATAVSSREVFCKRVSIPASDPAEVEQMLALQVEKWSPLSMEEVVWSYEILGSQANASDVLVVFGRKENLFQRAREFGEKLLPDLIDVDLMVLWRTLHGRNAFEGKDCCALLWVDAPSGIVKSMLLKAGTPLLVEHLPMDAADPAVLSRALSHWLVGAEAKLGASRLDEILLLVPDELRASISNELGLELGAVVTPLAQTEDLVSAAGLARRALSNGTARVNLLPLDLVERQKRRLFRQQAGRVGFIVLAVYLVILLFVGAGLAWRKLSISRIESKLAAHEPAFRKSQQLQAEVDFLERKFVDPRSALETLRVVTEGLPEQLALTHFACRQGQGLELRGTFQNAAAAEVYRFFTKLEDCGLFSKVTPGQIRNTPPTFDVSCAFGTPPAKSKPATSPQPPDGKKP